MAEGRLEITKHSSQSSYSREESSELYLQRDGIAVLSTFDRVTIALITYSARMLPIA